VHRQFENGQTYERSERLFAAGHRWYFTTREGQDVGPYWDRREAELALAAFVATKIVDGGSGDVPRMGQARDATEFEAMVAELVGFFRERRRRSATSAFIWALKRLQTLRRPGSAENNPQVRMAALEYGLAESDDPDRLSTGVAR
jgi:hypothetical protein